jgi:hypothetical protein
MHDYEGSRSEFLKLLAQAGEEPSFIVRARSAESAFDALLQNCLAKREDLLRWPYRHLANLAQHIGGDWQRIAPLLAKPESAAELKELHARAPKQFAKIPNCSATDKGSLRQFLDSAERFNRGWRAYLADVDYESVNVRRRDYNQYYPLEKSCAFGIEMVSEDFQPLDMIDIEFLVRQFPYFPVPKLA